MIHLSIDLPSDANQRIDKFLRKFLPNAPLGGIFKWIRTGKIKVNSKKVDQNYRVSLGDSITFFLTEEEMSSFKHSPEIVGNPEVKVQKKQFEVLYEDSNILIVNKPYGMNVHPGDHKSQEVSLIELVHDYLGKSYNSLSFKPSLVHRIDRDTSGCIIIAKEKRSLEKLLLDLQSGEIRKVYHALVLGNLDKKHGTIDKKLIRIENAKDEAKVQVHEDGLKAVTHFRVLKEGIKEKYSLVECEIETGRTHQIRVHLSSLGYPILGDKAYGNAKENSFARREYKIHRQMLHAFSLTFLHPITRKSIHIEAPYIGDMKDLIDL
ncbi:MAG: RluA family pseudouridine synthase [Candidatus Altimarinota bacterium]